jgi:hypothetical protein
MCARIEAAGGQILRATRLSNPARQSRFVTATNRDGTRIERIEAPGDPSLIPATPQRQ